MRMEIFVEVEVVFLYALFHREVYGIVALDLELVAVSNELGDGELPVCNRNACRIRIGVFGAL